VARAPHVSLRQREARSARHKQARAQNRATASHLEAVRLITTAKTHSTKKEKTKDWAADADRNLWLSLARRCVRIQTGTCLSDFPWFSSDSRGSRGVVPTLSEDASSVQFSSVPILSSNSQLSRLGFQSVVKHPTKRGQLWGF
jgi:hypothetical protein